MPAHTIKIVTLVAVLFTLFLTVSMLCFESNPSRGFPPTDGILNFDQVQASAIYRGAQPTALGFQALKNRGVGIVIDLRDAKEFWPGEEAAAKECHMAYVHIPLGGWQSPSNADISRIVDILSAAASGASPPVYVHCQHGCDRTGMVVACYRIKHDGWTADKALQEADVYGMSSLEVLFRRYVRKFAK